MKRIIWLILFVLISVPAYAKGAKLSAEQVERVKAFKVQIAEVDKKTLAKTIAELERTVDPQMNLEIQETVAKVYFDIVADQSIKDPATKEWLYSTVSMNMANIQFGGRVGGSVNRMITGRLQKALPKGIMDNPNFHVSVE